MPKGLSKILLTLIAIAAVVFGYGSFTGNWGVDHKLVNEAGTQIKVIIDEAKKTESPTSTLTASVSVPIAAMSTTSTSQFKTNAFIKRVVDGDTLNVDLDGEGEFTVRLLGINTPETVDPRKPVECFGKEASNFAKELLNEKRVRLDADPQADERDKYGRLLRNVILEDERNFNKLMVSEGYAFAYTSFPQNAADKRELKKLEEEARLAGRGLWNPQTCNGKQ